MWPKPEDNLEKLAPPVARDENPYGVVDGAATRWLTKDKRSLLIAEMADQHLQNTVRMLERKLAEFVARADASYGALGTLSGDMATYYAGQGAEEASTDEALFRLASAPILKGLRAEMQRRSLPELVP